MTMNAAYYEPTKARRKPRRRSAPMLAVAIQNKSSLDNDADLVRITRALARQLAEHVQPEHMIIPPALSYVGKGAVPADACPLVLFDHPDVADALGYHDETPEGQIYGRVFVEPIMGGGGTLLFGANSVSVTLSHELLEMCGDESANQWVDGPDGYDYARELCDAVEGDSYEIDGVSLSNFVLPSWFDPKAPRAMKFDHLSLLSAPFSMTPNGYMIRRTETGAVDNVWGKHFPEWKRALKAHQTARTSKRARKAHAK